MSTNLLDQYLEKMNRESPETQVYKHFGRPTMDDFLRRCEQLKNQLQLSQQEIEEGIHSACDFFGIAYPMLIIDLSNKKYGQTMFVNVDPVSFTDDVICYNIRQLQNLGVKNRDAFTLIMTHECAHRYYQQFPFDGPFEGHWKEELTCDFYMGVRSVLEQLTIGGVLEGTSRMQGCQTHPDGDLRKDAIQFGINTVLQFLHNGTPCILENFHKAILVYLSAEEMDLSERASRYERR